MQFGACSSVEILKVKMHTLLLFAVELMLIDACVGVLYSLLVYLFIWGFTSLSTLYRSYHDR